MTTIDRLLLRRVIAFANDKGGVFKTSLVAAIGALLAQGGHRILLIDLDPQANLGEDLGYTGDPRANSDALAQALLDGDPIEVLQGVRTNLDVIPGGSRTYEIQRALIAEDIPRDALASTLQDLAPRYDVILIDTPPKSPELVDLALAAARYMIIPARSDSSSRKGLSTMAAQYGQAQEVNPTLELLGICLTGIGQQSTRLRARAFDAMNADFDGQAPLFETTIRYVESAAHDVREYGRPPHELEQIADEAEPWYMRLRKKVAGEGDKSVSNEPVIAASAGSLAQDYQLLTREVLTRLVEAEQQLAAQAGEGTR